MNISIKNHQSCWLIYLLTFCATVFTAWSEEHQLEDEPQSKLQSWTYGIYVSPEKAKDKITPQFLRNLDIRDRYFVDALRMYIGTEQLKAMSLGSAYLTPLGQIITNEVKRRGDEVIPVFIALMEEPKNPFWKIKNQILHCLPSFETLDLQPILDYVRHYLKEHPNEVETMENTGDYGAITNFISSFGTKEDLPSIQQREMSTQYVTRLKDRLAKEKLTGTTVMQERQRIREISGAGGRPPPLGKVKEPNDKLEPDKPPQEDFLLWVLLIIVILAVGMAIWRGVKLGIK